MLSRSHNINVSRAFVKHSIHSEFLKWPNWPYFYCTKTFHKTDAGCLAPLVSKKECRISMYLVCVKNNIRAHEKRIWWWDWKWRNWSKMSVANKMRNRKQVWDVDSVMCWINKEPGLFHARETYLRHRIGATECQKRLKQCFCVNKLYLKLQQLIWDTSE